MRQVTDKRVVLEVALIRLCRPEMDRDNDALINRMENIEREIKNGAVIASQSVAAPAEQQAPKPVVEKKKLPAEIAADVRRAAGVINEVIKSLTHRKPCMFQMKFSLCKAGQLQAWLTLSLFQTVPCMVAMVFNSTTTLTRLLVRIRLSSDLLF